MVCSKCGHNLDIGEKYCTKCGEKYVSEESSEKNAIISLVLGIIGLLFFGILLVPGIIGIIFGTKCINSVHRRMAIMGIILNSLQFLILLIGIIVIIVYVNNF